MDDNSAVVEVREISADGCRELWAHVTKRAVDDLMRKKSKNEETEAKRQNNREAALSWIKSSGFDWVCDVLGVNADKARKAILDIYNNK